MSENYYDILGVNPKSSKDEIKKAYRNLSMKYHPDKNDDPNSTQTFQKINDAWQTLGDDEKRNQYNMMQNNPFKNMGMNMGMNMGGMGMGVEVPLDDILNSFFGGGLGGPGFAMNMNSHSGMGMGMGNKPNIHIFHGGIPMQMNFQKTLQKPSPIIKNISITISQVLTGAKIPIDIERWIVENGIKVFEKETKYVDIPKGVDDNELILLASKGNVLNENCKGDIKLFVSIVNDSMFKRSGLDLIIDKNITLKDALCGFSFEIKYINGKTYTLNNNSGNIIPCEYKKIVPNMGLTRDNHTGNMIIIFHIDFPEKLTTEQIDKLREIL